MESIAGERTLDTFKILDRASEYYKANIAVSANGKAIPVESIVMSSDGIRLLYTFAFRWKKIKKIVRTYSRKILKPTDFSVSNLHSTFRLHHF